MSVEDPFKGLSEVGLLCSGNMVHEEVLLINTALQTNPKLSGENPTPMGWMKPMNGDTLRPLRCWFDRRGSVPEPGHLREGRSRRVGGPEKPR